MLGAVRSCAHSQDIQQLPACFIEYDEGLLGLLAGQNTQAPSAAAAPKPAHCGGREDLLPGMAPEIQSTSTASLCYTLLQVCVLNPDLLTLLLNMPTHSKQLQVQALRKFLLPL